MDVDVDDGDAQRRNQRPDSVAALISAHAAGAGGVGEPAFYVDGVLYCARWRLPTTCPVRVRQSTPSTWPTTSAGFNVTWRRLPMPTPYFFCGGVVALGSPGFFGGSGS